MEVNILYTKKLSQYCCSCKLSKKQTEYAMNQIKMTNNNLKIF